MARKTISQRIRLIGGDKIERALREMGEQGEKAFRDIQAAAEKLKGPGAEFARRMDRVQRKIRDVGESMQRVGARARNWGAGLSAAVTAPVLGVARAMNGLADRVRGFEQQARISDATFQQFQRLAYAAQTVGVEQENLGDIFKDVQDKIGDYLATGGGELKDFFEKIAPQAGLTAEAIARLSGPEALQAYFDALEKAGVGQKEMVFYLEAIGNDASKLIPLLRDNGAAFEQLGQKAQVVSKEDAEGLRDYQRAMRELRGAVQNLGVALATSGVVEMVTDLVKGVTGFVQTLSETSPTILKWGATIAGVVAFLAPLLAMLGLAAQGIGAIAVGFSAVFGSGSVLLPVLAKITGAFGGIAGAMRGVMALVAPMLGWPVLLAAAVGALAVVVYKHWDEIVAAIREARDWIAEAWAGLWSDAEGVFASFGETLLGAFEGIADGIGSIISGIFDRLSSMVTSAKNRLASLADSAARALGFSGGGQVPAFAGGGRVRGPGTSTSDSILARLSSGEFVVRARAVQHYGPQLLDALNRMTLPRGLVPGYAAGGLAGPTSAPTGGSDGGAYATLNLSIGGEVFAGLTAPRETAERLIRFATAEEVKSAGRRPAWYGGG